MSEFSKVTHEWHRMCDCFFDGTERTCDKLCPLYEYEVCSKSWNKYPVPLEMTQELSDKIEQTIMRWAAENPEPVYPLWGEWLVSIGAAHNVPTGIPFQMADGSIIDPPYDICVDLYEPIPADIAKKLGIRQKGELK